MGSNNCFSKIIADAIPPWHRVNTHLNAAMLNASAFIELLTPMIFLSSEFDQQHRAASYHFNSYGSSK